METSDSKLGLEGLAIVEALGQADELARRSVLVFAGPVDDGFRLPWVAPENAP